MADEASREPPAEQHAHQGHVPQPDDDVEGQGVLQPGPEWEGGWQPVQSGSRDGHLGQAVVGQQGFQAPPQGYQVPQQIPQLPQQGLVQVPVAQQGYGAPAAVYPYQGLPTTPQQAGQLPYQMPSAGQVAEHAGQPPALQISVGAFGGATIRIQSPALAAGALAAGASAAAAFAASKVADSAAGVVGAGLAAGVATGITTLAAFYMGNRQQTDEAIRRVVERERHIQVENIEEGSLLVRVTFLSEAGYMVLRTLNEKLHVGTDRTCLQLLLEDELQRIGWTGPIHVGLEGWWFADEERQEEEQEEAAGGEEDEERWEWAGMADKRFTPRSLTTEGDSGLPEDVSSVAAMSITSAEEVEEGPFKWLRASLQKHKDSSTAQRYIAAYRSWEEGAEILTSSRYTDLGGLKALVWGFMQRDIASPGVTSIVLYKKSWLSLRKAMLNQLITSQLHADSTDSTCLLLTALQLRHGDSQVQALQQVVAAILQHGPGDWLYQHLHHIYCYLGWTIWMASPKHPPTKASQDTEQPTTDLPALSKALSAMASSLMYKQDHLNAVYFTAVLSKEASETEAIRQFEHFIGLAPKCDRYVPDAHYHLATLYGQQQDRQKVIHHFNRGQQTEGNKLPLFPEVAGFIKDPAKKAFEATKVNVKDK